jgi:hypothetical protein
MKGLVRLGQSGLRLSALAAAAVIMAAVASLPAPAAATSVTPCSNEIWSCGCTITTSGVYLIEDNLDAGQGLTSLGDCIDVAAGTVILQSDPTSIDCALEEDCNILGSETCSGTGIHILRSAANVSVQDVLVGDWNVGILDEGNGARIGEFETAFNCQAGVELKQVNHSAVGVFDSFENFYGVWLNQASDNQVGPFPDFQNTDGAVAIHANETGIFVGCSANGVSYKKCPRGVAPSNRNFITWNGVEDNLAGIAVDLGNVNNTIDDNFSVGNFDFDMIDANLNCGTDIWFDNSFNSSNQGCIH